MSLVDFLSFEFVQNAVLAAVCTSIICGVLGPLVLSARLISLAGGVAHAAYGGLGLALFFSAPAMLCSLGFSVLCGLLIAAIARRHPERQDAAISIIWAGGMSLGVLLASMVPGSSAAVMSYLFGAILATSAQDLLFAGGCAAGVLLFAAVFIRQLSSLCIDAEFARASGICEGALHYALVVLASIAIIVCLRAVGIILIVALLSIPAYIAALFCLRLWLCMMAATALSLAFCLGGLAAALAWDLSASGCIIALACAAFVIALGVKFILRRLA